MSLEHIANFIDAVLERLTTTNVRIKVNESSEEFGLSNFCQASAMVRFTALNVSMFFIIART